MMLNINLDVENQYAYEKYHFFKNEYGYELLSCFFIGLFSSIVFAITAIFIDWTVPISTILIYDAVFLVFFIVSFFLIWLFKNMDDQTKEFTKERYFTALAFYPYLIGVFISMTFLFSSIAYLVIYFVGFLISLISSFDFLSYLKSDGFIVLTVISAIFTLCAVMPLLKRR